MLVVKKDPTWCPSENKDLKVGEVIDITDAEYLIKKGIVTIYDPVNSNTIKQEPKRTTSSRKSTKKTTS